MGDLVDDDSIKLMKVIVREEFPFCTDPGMQPELPGGTFMVEHLPVAMVYANSRWEPCGNFWEKRGVCVPEDVCFSGVEVCLSTRLRLVPIESNGNGDRHKSRLFADYVYGAGLDTSTPRVQMGQFRYKAVDSLCCEKDKRKCHVAGGKRKPDMRPLAYVKE
ncbi:hypothetical protein CEXT_380741 [Caerostris extrusa]|uniref:Uncharacterized protein n=1 Tax=Caerostris extrusa TaxID=172846 RepID=A0AAV4TQW6_CAEEX|nr:hypothetical protein CEXT_380741 [Caerostris extrusa]